MSSASSLVLTRLCFLLLLLACPLSSVLKRMRSGEADQSDLKLLGELKLDVQREFDLLSPEEQAANDQFMPCCSRSSSALLVLDL